MGKGYLTDTNIIIYYLGGIQLSERALDFIDSIFSDEKNISVITRMELLGFRFHNPADEKRVKDFVRSTTVFQLSSHVEKSAIKLRKNYKLKLPDAVIAATALTNGFILLTRNTKDFKKINGLKLINPFDL
jgi:predicted nucleic acid-binding protein